MWVQLLQIKKTYKIMLPFPGHALYFYSTYTHCVLSKEQFVTSKMLTCKINAANVYG